MTLASPHAGADQFMPAPIVILVLALFLISIRRALPWRLPIWGIMLAAGLSNLLIGSLSFAQALQSIDQNIMLYLLGVFILSQALEESGYLEEMGFYVFSHAKTLAGLLFFIIIVCGLSSTLLMNDTLAIVSTPVLIRIAKRNKAMLTPLALALAYSISIGSVMSPIGNPQNLFIAIQGKMSAPFIHFGSTLIVPTLINLGIAYAVISVFYRKQLKTPIQLTFVPHHDKTLTRLCKVSLIMMLLLILLKIGLLYEDSPWTLPFSVIALGAASPILLFSKKRGRILKKLDWGTLFFFIGLFILIRAIWDAGFFQHLLKIQHINVHTTSNILIISSILSQFISNVPLVALYLPLLQHGSTNSQQLLALAAGSTIAGNFFIFGAASNIIILQNAEKRGAQAFGFWDFACLGLPIGILNLLVYAVFLQ